MASDLMALLQPGRIGSLELRNRIVMAPMGSNFAEADGHCGERIKAYYEARARGGAGLLIMGVAAIAFPAGTAEPFQLGISRDDFIPGLAQVAHRAHRHGAKIAIQLPHAGKTASRDRTRRGTADLGALTAATRPDHNDERVYGRGARDLRRRSRPPQAPGSPHGQGRGGGPRQAGFKAPKIRYFHREVAEESASGAFCGGRVLSAGGQKVLHHDVSSMRGNSPVHPGQKLAQTLTAALGQDAHQPEAESPQFGAVQRRRRRGAGRGFAGRLPRARAYHGAQPESDLPTWSHPVISGGLLILRDQDVVHAYDVRLK